MVRQDYSKGHIDFYIFLKGIITMAAISTTKCLGCGGCIDLCPAIAIAMIDDVVTIDPDLCTKCGICFKTCPVRAPHDD